MCPMQNPLPGKDPRSRSLAARLDRAARDMNAFLLVLAIGLATLDLTCLWAFKLRDALPAMTRTSVSSAPINPNGAFNKPAQAKPAAKPNPNVPGSGS
jgi:hypothetical protein